MVYTRHIKRNRWPSTKEEIDLCLSDLDNTLSASTIVKEMKISGSESELSLWEFENEEDLVLCILSPSKNVLESADFLKIDESLFEKYNLQIEKHTGGSVVQSLNDRHYDIVDMKYKHLGEFAKVILTSLKSEEKNLIKFSKKEVEDIIKRAIKDGKIEINKLDEDIRKKVVE